MPIREVKNSYYRYPKFWFGPQWSLPSHSIFCIFLCHQPKNLPNVASYRLNCKRNPLLKFSIYKIIVQYWIWFSEYTQAYLTSQMAWAPTNQNHCWSLQHAGKFWQNITEAGPAVSASLPQNSTRWEENKNGDCIILFHLSFMYIFLPNQFLLAQVVELSKMSNNSQVCYCVRTRA